MGRRQKQRASGIPEPHEVAARSKGRGTRRPWLRYLQGNYPAAVALGLPPGAAMGLSLTEIGAPMWPAAAVTPALVVTLAALARRLAWLRPGSRWLDVGLMVLVGATLAVIEAPWRDAYTADTFWSHTLGMVIGGTITFLLTAIFNVLALKLESRGPYQNMVKAGPAIMICFLPVAGLFAGFLLAPFSLLLWTTGMVEMSPAFLPETVLLVLVTALLFAVIGWPLSWLSGGRSPVASGSHEASEASISFDGESDDYAPSSDDD